MCIPSSTSPIRLWTRMQWLRPQMSTELGASCLLCISLGCCMITNCFGTVLHVLNYSGHMIVGLRMRNGSDHCIINSEGNTKCVNSNRKSTVILCLVYTSWIYKLMMIGWGWWLWWVWVELNQYSVNTSPDSSTTWCKLDTNTIRKSTLIIILYQHPNTSLMSLKTYFCCDCLHFFNLLVKSGQAFTISRSL